MVAREWLEADGLGGFASGTSTGVRTRRYHALLLPATAPPAGRCVLVNGFEAWVETPSGTYPLTSQHYAPGVFHPDGSRRIEHFQADPWPRWRFRLEDGTRIEQELFVAPGAACITLAWRLLEPEGPAPGAKAGISLRIRPLISGRDPHSLHHENPVFRFEAEVHAGVHAGAQAGHVEWRPYPGLPAIRACFNGKYVHEPVWYRSFLYEEELARGLDATEDLASPGTFHWDLSSPSGPAVWALAAGEGAAALPPPGQLGEWFEARRREEEARRRSYPSRLERAAAAYIVRRGKGRTIIAGYPWFTDWGRDTFIALRGLCLATGRLDEAREILVEWADQVSEGMLPNRFTEQGEAPEFNSVDASLWYIIAVDQFLRAMDESRRPVSTGDRRLLGQAVEAILTGYSRGTRYHIGLDDDGLLRAGSPGLQLTWMDAKVGDWVVTPRIGKPVEVEALWLNALWSAREQSGRWVELYQRGREAFQARFWNEAGSCLHDVVDVDHQPGKIDTTIRPNQIFAVGGLPLTLLDAGRARRVVDLVERRLWTPLGLRSLARGEPGYAPRYEGGVRERDGAYHQGTVWPWLLGPFAEAWLRVRGNDPTAIEEARRRFLEPLLRHQDEAGLGHISEIADAEAPHTPRGCPFQAWSVGEALRLERAILR